MKYVVLGVALTLGACGAFSQLVTSDPVKQQAIQQFSQEATCVGQATVNAVAETQADPKVRAGLSAASQVLGYGCGGVVVQPIPTTPATGAPVVVPVPVVPAKPV